MQAGVRAASEAALWCSAFVCRTASKMAPAAKIPPMIRTWRRVKTLGSAMIRDSVPAYGLRLPPSADQYRAREGRDGHADHGRLRGDARADQRTGRRHARLRLAPAGRVGRRDRDTSVRR